MIISQELILSLAGIITAVGGAWLTIRKISKDLQKSQEENNNEILKLAKNDLLVKEQQLESKILSLEDKVENLEKGFQKDLEYLKESHNMEIKNLGEKIESLREEIQRQHAGVLNLLTKMLDQRD